jgi:cold shock protein
MEIGKVREWGDEGWGVLDSVATPGGCFVISGSVRMEGYRSLQPGSTVTFEFERASQDGYDFRATAVWPEGVEPGSPDPVPPEGPGPGYSSQLDIDMRPSG